MTTTTWYRVLIISIFLLLDLVLGVYFMAQHYNAVPAPLQQLARILRLPLPDTSERALQYQRLNAPDITAESLLVAANAVRATEGVPELEYSEKLASIAGALLAEYQAENFTSQTALPDEQLASVAKKVGYDYSFLSHQVVLGPVTTRGVSEVWHTNTDQKEELISTRYTQAGYATIVVDEPQQYGVTVQVLGKPRVVPVVATSAPTAVSAGGTPSARSFSPLQTAPDISDEEVVTALNAYRATHNLYPLQVNDHLCEYAQKRVNDLVAFGSLDGHAGFTADFVDGGMPVGIRDYHGGAIGENLAHQYCRNMTTGDSFIAQTGTAIIEWCFDSSTKGHREAQLSTSFHNVCVRHGDHMFVVIFGE